MLDPSSNLNSLVMSISPGSWLGDKPLDFRAPPPSPIATGHRSSFTNESVLADFLRSSLKVPELVLPDNIVPRQKLVETPPKIAMESFYSSETDVRVSEVIKSVGQIGCFELVSHGISDDLIKEVTDEAGKLFDLSRGEKDSIRKSSEIIYGFEERSGVEEDEILGEEFVWGRDDDLLLKLEAVLPGGYSYFSAKMEILSSSIERIASRILQHLGQHNKWSTYKDNAQAFDSLKSVCCIHKHNNSEDMTLDDWAQTLRYDAIRMLIRRGSDYSHALGIHICNGCSEFHIYSKKGWVSFVPQHNALVITLGDQIQAWRSSGVQKHVIGKPIFKGDELNFKDKMRDHISMGFLYSPSGRSQGLGLGNEDDTLVITLRQQLYFAISLTLAYQLLSFLCSLF